MGKNLAKGRIPVPPFPKRGNPDLEDIDAVVQIRPKDLLLNQRPYPAGIGTAQVE